ncbi:mannitol dehydrogenase family protein [Azospirillum brasilense]|uniref:Mannitol dehydrogenase family protein n=1 Tax=Azospirillum brasilense TaxID=192 RepID=A0A0P0ET47_AZOBR|nr:MULTISPECIES: mannitol dehydrogenase family protein [Azospirillum]ALJ39225.1 mannitol dehydrogenase [Azospirillum brasilense]MDW7556885.1 mannitol dehydrogenase family protein [Azospirillum brasilense]MDW7596654.1 mannitol dehydrogenase family protein [Azospirillum brasilense]MDW7631535.1 mannitol dehydrogenase family protein [Azospirillum brasilense]MDX5950350.1 mannitol dehydrogenase family protein [Azospirillum brasilense]
MRLSPDTLPSLRHGVQRPGYDRAALTTGIVHLGIGAFHRAHQAVYTDAALARSFGPWGIVGVSLRSPDTRDALEPQGGLYTVAVRDAAGERLRVIGSVTELLVAPEDPAAVLDLLTRPSVRIVTLTVTEKGYCHDPATGALNEAHPDIVHDLANPERPRSVPGFLVEALIRRRATGVEPFTVLSCDNLPSNGDTAAGLLRRYAELRDPALGTWFAGNVACPNSMVDRIVPATTDADRDRVSDGLGLRDSWPVVTEPFSQWVIEDRFPTGRPAWELEGAELVPDVHPYETMKLRLLNGSHSTLAYLGYLAGYETVSDTMADPAFARLIRALMDEESGPTLHMPPGADLGHYKDALIERFRNPALRHRTWQIAMDGTQKLPQRLLGTIRDRLAAGAPIDRLALGVAGWMRYVSGTDEAGRPIDVRDPMSAKLAELAAQAGPDADRLASALFGLSAVFGDDLPRDPRFTGAVTDALRRLYAEGARAVVQSAAESTAG